ncbi:MAG: LamG-like jellyroll fold domain-containing protein, partial [Limisphaerales bacterium]
DLPLGSWYHIVLTYDGTTATLYKNGVAVSSGTPAGYVGNISAPFSVGTRSDNNFNWPGKAAEVAMYNGALSAARVAAHYNAGTTAPATYGTTVQADSPTLWWRFAGVGFPVAANSGSAGSAANGQYIYDAHPGVAGAVPPTFPGFATTNTAVAFDAAGGVVRIPALNLNTNTVTISAWVKANGLQANPGTALVVCDGGTTHSGLTLDQQYGGTLGLGMIWGGNNYAWSPQNDSGLPPLPDGQWAYVAMVIQPNAVTLYICDANYNDFASATINSGVNNPNEAFDGATLIGADAGNASAAFNGSIDEVAIFNQALSQGQVYTEYAAAVGGVPPQIFTDLQGPSGQVAAGDPLVLTIDVGGSPTMTYLWHKGGSLVGTTTSGTFTIASSALADSGTYDVTVTNTSGLVQSQPVPVTVVTPTAPAITGTQGFVNRALYTGGTL